MVFFENRSGMHFGYMSTGSEEKRHLQAVSA